MAQVSEMLKESQAVITKPSVATFETYEKQGTMQDALIYVAIAAAIAGLLGLGSGVGGLISGVLSTLVGFFVFTYLIFWIGKQQGGNGSLDEVAYTFALFWAPLSVLSGVVTLLLVLSVVGILFIPLVALVILIANIYFANLAIQSSMNMPAGGKTWLTLVLAAIGAGVVNAVIFSLLS